jgi:LytR cell envelope-related transcriptional attenuator
MRYGEPITMSFARVRALVVVGVLVLAAMVLVVVAFAKDTQTRQPVAEGCPDGWPIADVRLPEPKEVKINVYNATNSPGLASDVANDFENQMFVVGKTGTEKKALAGVAVLRYGPKAVGAAHLLRAYFLDEAKTEFNLKRKDNVVDVVIGTSYKQLATPTEKNQSLAALGHPTLPEGTCAAT